MTYTRYLDKGLALLYRARAASALKQTHQAETDLSQAKAHFEATNWAYGLWLAIIYAAELEYEREAFEQALDHFEQALKLSIQTEQVAEQILVIGHMALVETQLNTLEDARQHLLEALRLCQQHQVVYPIPIIMIAAATLLERYSEWEAAAGLAQAAWMNPASNFQVKRFAIAMLNRLTKHVDTQLTTNMPQARLRYAMETISQDELLRIQQLLSGLQDDERPLLTPREQEVLRLLVNGATNSQIGLVLNIAEGTVKRYTHHLFIKLGAQNRAEAAHRANDWNLI